MTENERYDWDLNGIWDYNDESDEYIESYKDITKLLNEQDERITELEKEVDKLQTFKKILEYAEKDMEERADWQAYCEKEFEGL